MAAPHTAHGLSPHLAPQLGSVLSSLTVSLEAELNRYRRNRRLDSLVRSSISSFTREDVFADIESDSVFDEETAATALAVTPPPVPPNRKLIASQSSASTLPAPNSSVSSLPASISSVPKLPASGLPVSSLIALPASTQVLSDRSVDVQAVDVRSGQRIEQIDPTYANTNKPSGNVSDASISTLLSPMMKGGEAIALPLPSPVTPDSYLASSEKLIESIENKTAPSDLLKPIALKPRRRVSLLAGAILAFLGLAGGLSASYMISNPLVAQRLVNGAQSDDVIANLKAFDPPGPDLSGAEFIELEIDNLSSLQMPQAPLMNPGDLPSVPAIPSGLAAPAPDATTPAQTNIPTPASSAADTRAVGTQAAVLPVGLTYYVTAPFTSERDLDRIRETMSEAFVRQFSDGNRVQVAAFDNAQSAQQFIEELKEKNISAEVYGPTTE